MPIKVADEVWIGTALLHKEHPERESFSTAEIVDRVFEEGLHRPLRPGVQIHVSQHCVANKRPNPGTYCMLWETARGQRRLFRHTDQPHEYRVGGKTLPAADDIPVKYRPLLEWYVSEYDRPREKGKSRPDDRANSPRWSVKRRGKGSAT